MRQRHDGYYLRGFVFSPNSGYQRGMSKYLVIQLARFGDILQTKRLMLSLACDGEVCLLVDKSLEALARMVYPGAMIYGLPAHGCDQTQVFKEGLELFKRLAEEHFDEVYILNHAGLSQSIAGLFPSRIVRGYMVKDGQSFRSNWVRLAFRWMSQRPYAPLNLVDFWAGLAPKPIEPDLVNPAANGGGKGLGVVLSGQNARRSLDPEIMAPIVHAAFERLGGCDVYFFGTRAEAAAGRRLAGLLPASVAARTVNLAGKTGWRELAGSLQGLDLLLSPDTGTVHLAAHLGVPVEGLFLSSAWAFETGPYGEGHTVWQASLPCSPCVESAHCPRDVRCALPFGSGAFLSAMQGKPRQAPEGMMRLTSGMDELGLLWKASSGGDPDPYAAARNQLRQLLGQYLGYWSASGPLSPERAASLAENLFQETDWILPQPTP